MSITVSNCVSICNSPLNNSTSKNLFSFPKQDRFKDHKKILNEKIQYDLPSVRMTRTTGFGYGNKLDFTKTQVLKNPAPNNYELKSEFEIDVIKKKGNSIGIGREHVQSQGILGQLNKFSPGPGTYDLGSTKSVIKWSFRQRVLNNDPLHSGTEKNPGAGTYDVPASINQSGKYFLSKFKSSGVKLFDPPRSKRFPETTRNKLNIGPGQYNIPGIKSDGNYFISTQKNSKCRTFSHDHRRTFSTGNFQSPGPGSYRLPSEFGHYESARASAQSLHEKK